MNSLNLLDDHVVFGANSLAQLESIVKNNNYKKLLLITGKKSFALSNSKRFFNFLKNQIEVHHFSYSGRALPLEDIIEIYNKVLNVNDIDLIIGIGGGTILDLTKILAILYSNKNLNEILSPKKFINNIDLILVPTTAGSGSEATSFAVVYKSKKKYSIVAKNLNIKCVVLDSSLLNNLPEEILKVTILDSLSQSIESIWARNANQFSQTFAKAALEILYENLFVQKSLKNAGDYLLASHLAGKAINISKTTASHAISYPLTAEFNIPHGLAVYLTLPHLCKFNYENMVYIEDENIKVKLQKSFSEILFSVFRTNNIIGFSDLLSSLFKRFDFSSKLCTYGIKEDDLDKIAQTAMGNGRIDNNPIDLTGDNVRKIIGLCF